MGLGMAAAGLPPGRARGQAADGNPAEYLELTGLLDSATSQFLVRRIRSAQSSGLSALIIRLDSAGPVDTPVEPVVRSILESRIPVIVWIAPGDALAGSGTALMALAAHRLVMSPGARLGPVYPTDLSFGGAGRSDRRGAAELMRAAALARGRDMSAASVDLLTSGSLPASRAVNLGLADAIAPNVQTLLQDLKGTTVRTPAGKVTLTDRPFALRFVKMSIMQRLTHSALRPEFAYLLFLLGFFGLIFELYNPGIGAAAMGGGIALMFSFYSFTALPVSWMAVAALVVALLLLNADLSTGRLGRFSSAGFGLLGAGSYFLYARDYPATRLPGWAMVSGILLTVLFFVSVMTTAIRARTARPLPGAGGLLEAVGVARTDIAPDGQVMAGGTLWRARTLGAAIGEGTAVRIKGVSGLMLMVEPTSEAPSPAGHERAPSEQGPAPTEP